MWFAIVKILSILGALGVFLYGMKVMSEGVQKVAGDSMRKALATMTKNRFSAAFTGFFTTCLVQSSSATTVLVVSFVNAGLLTLVESIGVIMGANIGTTITAWLVAMVGKFQVSAIALPMIGLGLPMFYTGKDRWRHIGETLIGFGLLFFGLSLLKDAVPDVKTMLNEGDTSAIQTIRDTIHWIQAYEYIDTVLFLLAGIILTLVVQSSSAAMAITITCALQGWLGDDPYTVFKSSAAIVLGENIGTTVTAWLASISANVNAKRAARAHFLFNAIGTIWAVLLIGPLTLLVWRSLDYFPQWMVDIKTKKAGTSIAEDLTMVAFAVAIFHTCFNFLNLLFLIPFTNQIANLVTKWVKDKPEGEDAPVIQYISQNLVDLGELNIVEADSALKIFSSHCIKMFDGYVDVFDHPEKDMSALVSKLKSMEDDADGMMHDITNYLVRCTSHDLSSEHAEKITGMLRITAELEECSDAIYRLVKLAERKYSAGRQFSDEQTANIKLFTAHIGEFLGFTHDNMLKKSDSAIIAGFDAKAAEMRNDFNKAAMKRMKDGKVKLEMININTNNELRGIANQLSHIVITSSEIAE